MDFFSMCVFAAGIGMGLGAVGTGIGQGFAVKGAVEGVAQCNVHLLLRPAFSQDGCAVRFGFSFQSRMELCRCPFWSCGRLILLAWHHAR